jgi:AcrR family transcriptional regulator
MQVKKTEVKEKIYNAAFEEFYEKNFKKATMNTISERSGVPVGNIYRYYVNKEALLQDIIGDVAICMSDLFSNKSKQNYHKIKNNKTDDVIKKICLDFLEKLLDLFSKNRKNLEILLEKSHGSKYENFKKTMQENFIKNAISTTKLAFDDRELNREDLELIKISAGIYLKGLESIMMDYSYKDDLKKKFIFRYNEFFMTDIVTRLKTNC